MAATVKDTPPRGNLRAPACEIRFSRRLGPSGEGSAGPGPDHETLEKSELRVRVPAGTTLLEAARAEGYPIGTDCGGFGKCRRCRSLLLAPGRRGEAAPAPPSWLDPPTPAEQRQLSQEERDAGWRLACQVRVKGGLTAFVPFPEDRPARKSIDTQLPVRIKPWAERSTIWLRGKGEKEEGVLVERTLSALRRRRPGLRIDESLALRLPSPRQGAEGRDVPLTVTITNGCVVDLECEKSERKAYGAVIDIGTTNLCGYLIDMATGALAAESARPNTQREWGADLMTRVLAASPAERGGKDALARLSRAVRRDVDEVLTDLLRRVRAKRRHLIALIFVGNSVMHHLFLGLPVESFGFAPYAPLRKEGVAFRPAEKGIRLPPSSRAHFFPLLAGFVGADAVGVALALNLDRTKGDRAILALDLGTNVEILLGIPGESLWCASTPAGPAFEAGEIRCGMTSGPGAVCEVDVRDGEISLRTIEDAPPRGICGTGLIDAAAGLLECGVIDPTGRMRGAEELPAGTPEDIRRRIFEAGGSRKFMLWGDASPLSANGVYLDQWDVRKLQAAKAAVRAGVGLLLAEAGLGWGDVGDVCLAGAFGTSLRPEKILRIGLIPEKPPEHIRSVGNAAASGARLALLSRTELKRAGEIQERVQYVELAGRPEFEKAFIEAIPFPA